jgi:hypothetical protein
MIDIDTSKRVHSFFSAALTNAILPVLWTIGLVVMLTAAQIAFAGPSSP